MRTRKTSQSCHDSIKTRWEICFSCLTPSVSLTLWAAVSSCSGGDGEGGRGGHGTAGAIGWLTYEDTTRENKLQVDFLALKYEFNPANREHSQNFGQHSGNVLSKVRTNILPVTVIQCLFKCSQNFSTKTVFIHPSWNVFLLKHFSFFLNVSYRNVQGTFKSNVCKIIKWNVPSTRKKKKYCFYNLMGI